MTSRWSGDSESITALKLMPVDRRSARSAGSDPSATICSSPSVPKSCGRRSALRDRSITRFRAIVRSHAWKSRWPPVKLSRFRTAFTKTSPRMSSGSGALRARRNRSTLGAASRYRSRHAHSAPLRAAASTAGNASSGRFSGAILTTSGTRYANFNRTRIHSVTGAFPTHEEQNLLDRQTRGDSGTQSKGPRRFRGRPATRRRPA